MGDHLRWMNIALSEAQSGKRWSSIEASLRIARDKEGYRTDAPYDIEGMVRTVYDTCIKTEGPKNASEWIDIAMREARSGTLWGSIQTSINIANDYARESGIELDEGQILQIRGTYQQGIKKFGLQHSAKWLRIAAEEFEKGVPISSIEISLRIAGNYAREAGKPLPF